MSEPRRGRHRTTADLPADFVPKRPEKVIADIDAVLDWYAAEKAKETP